MFRALQSKDFDSFDARCADVFALGVVLFKLMTGKRPFTSDKESNALDSTPTNEVEAESSTKHSEKNENSFQESSEHFKDLIDKMLDSDH